MPLHAIIDVKDVHVPSSVVMKQECLKDILITARDAAYILSIIGAKLIDRSTHEYKECLAILTNRSATFGP